MDGLTAACQAALNSGTGRHPARRRPAPRASWSTSRPWPHAGAAETGGTTEKARTGQARRALAGPGRQPGRPGPAPRRTQPGPARRACDGENAPQKGEPGGTSGAARPTAPGTSAPGTGPAGTAHRRTGTGRQRHRPAPPGPRGAPVRRTEKPAAPETWAGAAAKAAWRDGGGPLRAAARPAHRLRGHAHRPAGPRPGLPRRTERSSAGATASPSTSAAATGPKPRPSAAPWKPATRAAGAPGCGMPAAWCTAHHLKPWSQGGPTSLQDTALFCFVHHNYFIHLLGWTITGDPNATLHFTHPQAGPPSTAHYPQRHQTPPAVKSARAGGLPRHHRCADVAGPRAATEADENRWAQRPEEAPVPVPTAIPRQSHRSSSESAGLMLAPNRSTQAMTTLYDCRRSLNTLSATTYLVRDGMHDAG